MTGIRQILTVDQNMENLIVLERIIYNLNVEFSRCLSFHAVDKLLASKNFSLAIVGMSTDYAEGLMVLDQLRQNKLTVDLPVILISHPIKNEDNVINIYKKGIVDVILRPIIPEVLLAKVKLFLQFDYYKKITDGRMNVVIKK